jgi:hypothetical protein
LRDLAGDRIELTLLSRDTEFVYRPMAVAEPFGRGRADRHPLADIAADAEAELVLRTGPAPAGRGPSSPCQPAGWRVRPRRCRPAADDRPPSLGVSDAPRAGATSSERRARTSVMPGYMIERLVIRSPARARPAGSHTRRHRDGSRAPIAVAHRAAHCDDPPASHRRADARGPNRTGRRRTHCRRHSSQDGEAHISPASIHCRLIRLLGRSEVARVRTPLGDAPVPHRSAMKHAWPARSLRTTRREWQLARR